jgi:hypothetical protein
MTIPGRWTDPARSFPGRHTSHAIGYAEASAVAWILDVVAERATDLGCPGAGVGFATCAAVFRSAVIPDGPRAVEMTFDTIENLWTTVKTVGDHLLDEDRETNGCVSAWGAIADHLFLVDGAGLSGFLAACPVPEMLPLMAQSVLARIRIEAAAAIDPL